MLGALLSYHFHFPIYCAKIFWDLVNKILDNINWVQISYSAPWALVVPYKSINLVIFKIRESKLAFVNNIKDVIKRTDVANLDQGIGK